MPGEDGASGSSSSAMAQVTGGEQRGASADQVVTDRIEQQNDQDAGAWVEQEMRPRNNAVDQGVSLQQTLKSMADATEHARLLANKDKFEQRNEQFAKLVQVDKQKGYVAQMANRLQAADRLKGQTTGLAGGLSEANAKKYGAKAGAMVIDHTVGGLAAGVNVGSGVLAAQVTYDSAKTLGKLNALSKQDNLSDDQASMIAYLEGQEHGKLKNAALSLHQVTSKPNTLKNVANHIYKRVTGTQGKAREECASKLVTALKGDDNFAVAAVSAIMGKAPNTSLQVIQDIKSAPNKFGVAFLKSKLAK